MQAWHAIEQFRNLHPRFEHEDWQNEDLRELARLFLVAQGDRFYRFIRRELAQFCLEFSISPSQVAHVAKTAWPNDPNAGEEVSQAIDADAPLQVVTLGYRLFWT
jgi:hypothetical protein